MIHLTRSGLVGSADPEELARQFERSHVFRLLQLLPPELIRMVGPLLEYCLWMRSDHGDIATEEIPAEPLAAGILQFATNTPEFLELIRQAARCRQITRFSGRIYRMGPGHFDSWHGDVGPGDRLVGMSINLSPRPYEGGVFRLRDETTGEMLYELPNISLGDAICFRISTRLKHMVTPVVGSEPKIAFAGWFQSGDTDFYSILRRGRAARVPD